jgi:hypothetical protein
MAQTQVTITASLGTAGPTNYSTLGAAFAKVNDGTHKGEIVIKINGNTTETATAALNASGSGSASYTGINIYPTTTGLSISGAVAAGSLINLNGADNVIIDGRVNATGSDKSLTISNTSAVAMAGTSTIRFINDASSNTVQYCILQGSSSSSLAGTVLFSTTTGTTGNDNNTINRNDITNAGGNRPYNSVLAASATAGKQNNNNTISNNNCYDFLNASNSSYGVYISDNNTAYTISGNSFYETTGFTTSGSITHFGIRIDADGGGTKTDSRCPGTTSAGRPHLAAGRRGPRPAVEAILQPLECLRRQGTPMRYMGTSSRTSAGAIHHQMVIS